MAPPRSSAAGLLAAAVRLLGGRWIPLIAALLAFALTLPSIDNGLGIDDHMYRARVLSGWSAARSARDLFLYADPDRPAQVTEAMQIGELPWWAAPGLRWRWLRPIPQLIHHAEFRIFGRGGEAVLHLHSVLWMAAVAYAAALLFRRMIAPPWAAGLAAIAYAIDDAHGFTVGWLGNRCMLMATVFAIVTLIAHDRWRREGWRPGAVVAPAALGLALLCAEASVAVTGYLAAHLVVLDRAPWRRRLCVAIVYAAVLAGWRIAFVALGYGSQGTGSYTDPIADPAAFAVSVAERIPIYVHSLLGLFPADLWEVFFVRRDLVWVMVTAGAAFAALVGWVIAPLVRRDPIIRFFATGAVLALVPVCAAHPTDRQLFLVGLGGTALVARTIQIWFDRRKDPGAPLLTRGRAAGVLAWFFVVTHLVIAPALLPVRSRLPGTVSRGLAHVERLLPDDPGLADQDLVLVNVPFKYLCNFVSVVRRSVGGPSPRRWRCLGVSGAAVEVERAGERALVLRPAQGYVRHFEDTNVRSPRIPFSRGERVELPGFVITVRELTPDRRPAEVMVEFDRPLESPDLRWLVWQDGRYRPFTPPAGGTSLTLPAQTFAWSDLLRAGERP